MNDKRIAEIVNVNTMIVDVKQKLSVVLEEELLINGNIPENLSAANLKEESNIGIRALQNALEHLNETLKALDIICEIHDAKDQYDLSPYEILADKISKSVAGD